ncbi:hypothetical protein ACFVMC_29195 [Nocardia sp. NPDC127579]|uniref:hypothetical protein n=1 Tax=Nocardia sp. NPDC127579 TaxID=3345402 RepID=UPI00362E1507
MAALVCTGSPEELNDFALKINNFAETLMARKGQAQGTQGDVAVASSNSYSSTASQGLYDNYIAALNNLIKLCIAGSEAVKKTAVERDAHDQEAASGLNYANWV